MIEASSDKSRNEARVRLVLPMLALSRASRRASSLSMKVSNRLPDNGNSALCIPHKEFAMVLRSGLSTSRPRWPARR